MQPIKVGLLEVKSLLKRYSWHVAELPERESVVGIGGLIIGINDSDPIDWIAIDSGPIDSSSAKRRKHARPVRPAPTTTQGT